MTARSLRIALALVVLLGLSGLTPGPGDPEFLGVLCWTSWQSTARQPVVCGVAPHGGEHDGHANSPGYLRVRHRTADGGERRGQGQAAGHGWVQFRSPGVWQRDQLRPLPGV